MPAALHPAPLSLWCSGRLCCCSGMQGDRERLLEGHGPPQVEALPLINAHCSEQVHRVRIGDVLRNRPLAETPCHLDYCPHEMLVDVVSRQVGDEAPTDLKEVDRQMLQPADASDSRRKKTPRRSHRSQSGILGP
jgi:hypothetical protein